MQLRRFQSKADAETFLDWLERAGGAAHRVTFVAHGPGEWQVEYLPPGQA